MIELIGDQNPEIRPSERFIEKLKDFDPKLYVVWNFRKHRWVIEECIEHSVCAPTGWHSHLCRRSHVWLVREPDDSYLELCDRVIDELKGMNVQRKYGSMENMIKAMDEIDRKNDEQFRKDLREGIQERKKDNKRQLEHAITLIDRHDFFNKPHN
jgi:hypothetical protein